eukprot:TRINITY_DN55670_c0_g1_i1.p1 TRINITY_DN55670_c0_g1~~TRINITY_DN55670_c0_g1_i1.p1  ORF type:complete len:502 (+),score=86.39 TRINITY_DN55670_c0_g1_i1:95-1600(+)
MARIAAVAAALALPVAGDPRFPLPPRQTGVQQDVLRRARAAARDAQAQGTAAAAALLDSALFRKELARLAPELAGLTSERLLALADAAQEVAEIIHGFPARYVPGQNNALDFDIAMARNATWFYNQWQMPLMFPGREQRALRELLEYLGPAGAAEVQIWGFPPFSGTNPYAAGLWPGGWPASMSEANDRAVYGVWNQHRLAFPPFLWGDVAVVFNTTALHDALLITPVDTGDFTIGCNTEFIKGFCKGFEAATNLSCAKCDYCRQDGDDCVPRGDPAHNCTFWPGTVSGTWGLTRHLYAPYSSWPSTARFGPDVWARRLSRLFARMLLPWGRTPNMTGEWIDYFYEADMLANPRFPEAVKFVVAWVPSLFGTTEGESVRAWCAQWGWPLVWALGPNAHDYNNPAPPRMGWQATGRVVDPLGLHALAHNVTLPASAVQEFTALWQEASELRQKRNVTPADAAEWWRRLSGPGALSAEPLRPGQCAAPGRCLGTDAAGTCLCY